MTFFRWQTALNPESKTSTRDRRRGPRAQRTRFRPWADLLEDRVVLATITVTSSASVGLGTLDMAIGTANGNGMSNTIELTFLYPTVITLPSGTQPITGSGSGFGLSIINLGAQVTIQGPGAGGVPIFTIQPTAGAVQIDGLTAPITLELGKNTAGNGGAIDFTAYATPLPINALSVSNVLFTGNSAVNGGAIYAASGSGPVTVSDCKFGPSPGSPAIPAIHRRRRSRRRRRRPATLRASLAARSITSAPPRSPLPTANSCPTSPRTARAAPLSSGAPAISPLAAIPFSSPTRRTAKTAESPQVAAIATFSPSTVIDSTSFLQNLAQGSAGGVRPPALTAATPTAGPSMTAMNPSRSPTLNS